MGPKVLSTSCCEISDKLTRIGAKADQLDERRPVNFSLQFKDIYSDHPNLGELVWDMFVRVTDASCGKADNDEKRQQSKLGDGLHVGVTLSNSCRRTSQT